MNENLNLVEILKDCHKGTKLYSSVFGSVEFDHINIGANYPIVIRLKVVERYESLIKVVEGYESLTSEGKMFAEYDGECILFPSREERDWGKFKPKKEKFDPKTLKPFDRVLSRYDGGCWSANLFSHIEEENNKYHGTCSFVCNGSLVKFCIPYNDDTKHLLGTSDEAPEYYRYWED